MSTLYRSRHKPLLQILARSFPLTVTWFKRSYYGLIQLRGHLVLLDMAFSVPLVSRKTQMAQTLLFDVLVLFRCLRYSQSCPEATENQSRSDWNPCTRLQSTKLEIPFPPGLLKQPARPGDGLYSRALSYAGTIVSFRNTHSKSNLEESSFTVHLLKVYWSFLGGRWTPRVCTSSACCEPTEYQNKYRQSGANCLLFMQQS